MRNHWERKARQLLFTSKGREALKKFGLDVEVVKDEKALKEKPIVAVLCPTYRAPEPQMQDALGAMVRYTRQKDFAVIYSGPPIGAAVVHWSRNWLITEQMKSGKPWSHILFIDDDIVVEADALERLLSHKKDIVAGLCTRRSDPPIPNMRHFDETSGEWSFIWDWPKDKLIEVDAAGTGLMLISQHALEQVAQAYFDCLWEKEFYGLDGEKLEQMKASRLKQFDAEKVCYWFRFLANTKGSENGEDVSFCQVAKRHCGIPIYVDTSVQPGHIGKYDFGIKDFLPHQKMCMARAGVQEQSQEPVDWTTLLPQIRPEVAVPSAECPHPELWKCFDEMATEIEVLDLLYALIRTLKPRTVVETGTYVGLGTLYMARAVKDNGFGHVYSSETDEAIFKKADALLKLAGFGQVVAVEQKSGEQMIRSLDSVDFAFLDSNLDTRIGEMEVLLSRLSPSAVVAVHDTNTVHDLRGGPRTPFFRFAEKNGLQLIQFDTPRGLTLLRKSFQEPAYHTVGDRRIIQPAY